MRKIYELAKKCKTYKEFKQVMEEGINTEAEKLVNEYLVNVSMSIEDLKSKNRCREFTDMRMMVSYLLCQEGFHFTQIAQIINRDRTSIIYYCKTVPSLIQHNPDFREKYNKLVGNC